MGCRFYVCKTKIQQISTAIDKLLIIRNVVDPYRHWAQGKELIPDFYKPIIFFFIEQYDFFIFTFLNNTRFYSRYYKKMSQPKWKFCSVACWLKTTNWQINLRTKKKKKEKSYNLSNRDLIKSFNLKKNSLIHCFSKRLLQWLILNSGK